MTDHLSANFAQGTPTSPCPTLSQLDDYLADQSATHSGSTVESHVASCEHCWQIVRWRDVSGGVIKRVAALRGLSDEVLNDSPHLRSVGSVSSIDALDSGTNSQGSESTLSIGQEARRESVGLPLTRSARYRVLRPHAKGALGEVFVAHDEELDREVAVKEIQARFAGDFSARNRFVLEAQLTGGLEHPGIVPVYGLGTNALGRPYYAMKFLRGDTLKTAVERFHEAAAPAYESREFRQLLRHFIDVCNALAYAHDRGVLHRDLKPSNIMLGNFGETLVVDWGLAKVQRAEEPANCEPEHSVGSTTETVQGSVIGTPSFMSPEQAAGRLNALGPATDIYGLGATLFYMLTKRPPFTGSDTASVLRDVQRGDLMWPADASRIPLALQAICRQAMALQPSDRYATALSLAADVEKWLADEPVSAHRESVSVRARRWLRKRPRLVASASATILVGILGLTVGSLLIGAKNQELTTVNRNLRTAQEETERKRKEAELERNIAQAVREFLQFDLLKQASPAAQADRLLAFGNAHFVTQENPTIKELLDRAAATMTPENFARRFPDQPLIQAEILTSLGDSYVAIGKFDSGVVHLEHARALLEPAVGEQDARTLVLLGKLAVAYNYANRSTEAIPLLETTVNRLKAKLGAKSGHTLTAMNSLAGAYCAHSQYDKALPIIEELLAHGRATLAADDPLLLGTLNNLAMVYRETGKVEQAIAISTEAIAKMRAKVGVSHPQTLQMMSALAQMHVDRGDHAQALPILEEAYPLMVLKIGPNHPVTLLTARYLATAYLLAGRPDEGMPLLLRTIAQLQEAYGPSHPSVHEALATQQRFAKAAPKSQRLAEFEQTVEELRQLKGEDDPETLNLMARLGLEYRAAGQLEKAIELLERTTLKMRKVLGEDDPTVALVIGNLASAYVDRGRSDKAEPLLKECLVLLAPHLEASNPQIISLKQTLSLIYDKAKKYEEALPLVLDLLAYERDRVGAKPTELLRRLDGVGLTYIGMEKLNEAIPIMEEALTLSRKTLGNGNQKTLERQGGLAAAYLRNKQSDKALPLFADFVASARQFQGPDSPQHADLLGQIGPELLKAGEFTVAADYLRRALTIRQKLQPNVQSTFVTQSQLGEALAKQKQFAEAETLLIAAYEKLPSLPGTSAAEITLRNEFVQRIVDLYSASDKAEQVKEWKTRLVPVPTPVSEPKTP